MHKNNQIHTSLTPAVLYISSLVLCHNALHDENYLVLLKFSSSFTTSFIENANIITLVVYTKPLW